MSVQLFLTLLFFFSTVSSLITEAFKIQFKTATPNLIVLMISCIVGILGTVIYYVATSMPLGVIDFVYALLMGLATWVTSMVGYDKVKQTLGQLFP